MLSCGPFWILNLAPYVIALVLTALIVLVAVYAWREMGQRNQRHSSTADSGWLVLGLLLLSVIILVFFALYVALSLAGTCSATALVPSLLPSLRGYPSAESS